MTRRKPSRCVIWGGYAWGNTGDELCLAAALERAQQQFDGSVTILSHHPEYTAQIFPQTHVIPCVPAALPKEQRWQRRLVKNGHAWMKLGRNRLGRSRWFAPTSEWMRCLYHAEQLYLAGGGYLSDLFGLELLLSPIELALDLELPVATAPLGLGPFKSQAWADRVARALRPARLQVRDAVSLEFCRQRGLTATLAPDDAFDWIKNRLPAAPVAAGETRAPRIGVCICTQSGQGEQLDLSDWWVTVLRGLKDRHPESVIEGFCFHTSPKREIQEMTRLFPLAGLPVDRVLAPIMDFRAATLALRRYDFIIATRFHAIVAANVFGIPNLAIASGKYYAAKMQAAASGYENSCQVAAPNQLSPAAFLDLCEKKIWVR